MDNELKLIEGMKHMLSEYEYRALMAKAVIWRVKHDVKNRVELVAVVNRVLAEHGLGSVSYDFCKRHEQKAVRVGVMIDAHHHISR